MHRRVPHTTSQEERRVGWPPDDVPVTCVGISIGGWDELTTPQRIRRRVRLIGTIVGAGFTDAERVLPGGRCLVFMLRAEPVATLVTLIDVLSRSESADLRVRMAVAAGWTGVVPEAQTVAEAMRLMRILELGHGASGPPLAVVIPDLLRCYAQTEANGHRVVSGLHRVMGPGMVPGCWVWPPFRRTEAEITAWSRARWNARSSGRSGRLAPARSSERSLPVSTATSRPKGMTALRRLVRWRTKTRAHSDAVERLRWLLRVEPGPAPLLALGAYHLRAGEQRAAMETCRYLLRHYPLTVSVYAVLGEVEQCDDLARAYLLEGLRLVRTRPELASEPGGLEHRLLLGLAAVAYRRNDQPSGDRFLNEAVDVHPGGGAPLRLLAAEALRGADPGQAHWLLAAARARTVASPDRGRGHVR